VLSIIPPPTKKMKSKKLGVRKTEKLKFLVPAKGVQNEIRKGLEERGGKLQQKDVKDIKAKFEKK
jgi:hypothetical protein